MIIPSIMIKIIPLKKSRITKLYIKIHQNKISKTKKTFIKSNWKRKIKMRKVNKKINITLIKNNVILCHKVNRKIKI